MGMEGERTRPSALPHNGHAAWISTKGRYVLLDPPECKYLVTYTVVPDPGITGVGIVFFDILRCHEAHGSHSKTGFSR